MNPDYAAKVPAVAKLLGKHGIEAGYVIPTATGLKKSILDATWPLRDYLARTQFHDFEEQPQGTESKRLSPIGIISGELTTKSKISLYRPETKGGDPRIWIYGLADQAAPGDLIALIVEGDNLYAVNCSREDLEKAFQNKNSLLSKLAKRMDVNAPAAKELLEKLRDVGAEGFVPSQRAGATGIGFTLESMLGIQANSSKEPDYKGIEIKSQRLSRRTSMGKAPRTTLFSKCPDWKLGPYSAWEVLQKFGYNEPETNRLQLYCSVDATSNNTLGFRLEPRPSLGHLANVCQRDGAAREDAFLWLMEGLRGAFSRKHTETFWVSAKAKKIDGHEYFHFVEAQHTRKPPIATFEALLSSGGICVDLTMSDKGNQKVRDHGFLFRILGPHFDELFPLVDTYSLS